MNQRFSRVRTGLLALLLAIAVFPAHAASDRVLIVVSGEGRDQGKARPGYEFDEFSQAYLILRDNGLAIDVASPQGGAVEADRYNPDEPFNARVLADAEAMLALAGTKATRDLDPADYAAVYVVGGKGAMFDLPRDTHLRRLIAGIYAQGGIVAAVCHGPAALADVRLPDGTLLVAGKAMTGFSNEEEALFGKKWAAQFPFLLEDAMRERGARWSEAPLMMPHTVVDGRLVTGQNPYSTPAVAEAIVRGTGRTPVARTPWRDEHTMALVQRIYTGETEAVRTELAARLADYHVDLVGLLGYYQLQAAATEPAIRIALTLMQLATPYMDAPQLKLAMAEAHWRLGDAAQARATLGPLLEAEPVMAEARQLMDRIGR